MNTNDTICPCPHAETCTIKDCICDPPKTRVKLVGEDGNAFAILGRCQRAARAAKWTPRQLATFMHAAQSGDYDHLLQTVMLWFEVDTQRELESFTCDKCGSTCTEQDSTTFVPRGSRNATEKTWCVDCMVEET